jgi:hypothetical protein
MDPIETLSNEHGLIRQFLDVLSIAAKKIENGQRPSTAFFEKQHDKRGHDTFEKCHKMVVDMGSIVTHLR